MVPIEAEASLKNSVLIVAVDWFEQLLRGSLGITIAVIAIALFGFAMLQGRLPLRDGLRIVMGCFVLFGAPAIAAALMGASRSGSENVGGPAAAVTTLPGMPSRAPNFDPYAGAAVPGR